MSQISLKNVNFMYHTSACQNQALCDVNLEIEKGGFYCILGRSGCGKSTLLKLIAGLLKPGTGEVLIDGKPLLKDVADAGIVFQDYTLFPWMTVEKNISFAIRHMNKVSKKKAKELSFDILSSVGLSDAKDLYPFELSGGMRQRAAIARALALDTDTLLLDEPFGALDAKNRADLQFLLLDLWERSEKKKTVIMVTHDINEAILLADKIIFMTPGKIKEVITVDLNRPRSSVYDFEGYRRKLIKLLNYKDEDDE